MTKPLQPLHVIPIGEKGWLVAIGDDPPVQALTSREEVLQWLDAQMRQRYSQDELFGDSVPPSEATPPIPPGIKPEGSQRKAGWRLG